MHSLLLVEGLHAGYGRKEIIHDVSFCLEPGEVVTLLGANGAGKSTLLRAIAGVLRPWEGRVTLDGEDATALPTHERARRGMAFLMQGGEVFPTFTARENLEIAASIAPSGDREERIAYALDRFPQIGADLGKRAGLFSGGQRKSLSIAMMLVQRPSVMLLDEPSAGLAPTASGAVLEAITHAAREWRAGVLLVEQRLRDALSVADRAVALVAGAIRSETPRPMEWISSNELAALVFGGPVDRENPHDE